MLRLIDYFMPRNPVKIQHMYNINKHFIDFCRQLYEFKQQFPFLKNVEARF